MRFAAALLGAVALCACSSNEGVAPSDASVDPSQLCVASACGTKTVLLTIPDAENILFTPEGRLFVSGGVNVYEITHDAEAWHATPLLDGSCNFTGLAQIDDVLYAACFSGDLYAARLTAHPALSAIHALGLHAPNGINAGPAGELYVVNGPLASSALPDPKIVRLRFDPADPMQVIEQTDWLTTGLSFPNGVQRRGNVLYVSDSEPGTLGTIKRLVINADGSPGTVETFATFNGLPDDFSLVGEAVLAVSFSNNQIFLFDRNGALQSSTDPNSFSGPSQVRTGQPPLFAPDDLLVTEKGLLGDNDSSIGNVLSVFRPNR